VNILRNKLTKRDVDVRFMDKATLKKVGELVIRCAALRPEAWQRSSVIKDSKIKVQAAIQDGKLRVTGKDTTTPEAAQALIRKISDMPRSFDNYR
jgi:uncharacterized protein YajQ (UPF0234 family)